MTPPHKFGVLGHNVSYSKSPDIFHAIFDHCKIVGTYDILNVSPDEFEARFAEIIESGYTGLSVTIPFKKRVIPLLDQVNPIASAIEAVNSIKADNSTVCGYNTDGYGFALGLKQAIDSFQANRALVLGCGGAARPIVHALSNLFGAKQIILLGRSEEKLTCFTDALAPHLNGAILKPVTYDQWERPADESFDIVVNCTPAGGPNQPDESPMPRGWDWSAARAYYDLNYNENNKIVAAAADAGIPAVDGAAMIVGQAVKSYAIWTGEQVDFKSIFATVFGDRQANLSR